MRREVIATVGLAFGLAFLGVAGYLVSVGEVRAGVTLAVVDVVAVACALAFGSLKVHR